MPPSPRRRFRLGPGLIAVCVVIGPGSVLTSSKIGASYGYDLVWVLVIAVVLMMVYLTLGARLGVIADASPGELVRRCFGRFTVAIIGIGVFVIASIFQVGNNLGVLGAAEAMRGQGAETHPAWDIALLLFVNAIAVGFLLGLPGLYRPLERVMTAFVAVMLIAFAVNLFAQPPQPLEVLRGLIPGRWGDAGNVADPIVVIGWIGTTFITAVAWYQGYLVRQKGWTIDDLAQGLFDARVSAVLLGTITWMIVATAAEGLRGQELTDLVQVASQLQGTFGAMGQRIFAAGLFSAAYSSYLVNASIGGSLLADGLGLGANPEQPWPRRLAALVLVLGMVPAMQVAVTGKPIVGAIVIAQATTVIIAPLLGVMLLLLTNRRDVMGEHRNGPILNGIAVLGLIVLFAMAWVVLTTKVLPAFQGWFAPPPAKVSFHDQDSPPDFFRSRLVNHRIESSKDDMAATLLSVLDAAEDSSAWLIDREAQWWKWSFLHQRLESRSAIRFPSVAGLYCPQHRAWLASDGRGTLAWAQPNIDQLHVITSKAPYIDRWLGWDEQGRAVGLSRWGRCFVRIEGLSHLSAEGESLAIERLDLNFAPADGVLLATQAWVADAFGGHLARIELAALQVSQVIEIDAFACGDIELDEHWLVLNHRVSDPQAPSTQENVAAGRCVDSQVSLLNLDLAMSDLAAAWEERKTIPLRSSSAFVDPGAMLLQEDGAWIASEGSQAVARVSWSSGEIEAWIPTGPFPLALFSRDDQTIWTVSRFQPRLTMIAADHQATHHSLRTRDASLVERGEQRFHDATLSSGSAISCASCHVDGHSSFRMADTLGDQSYGTPKLTPSLLGTIDTDPWGWLGNRKEFTDQVEQSVRTTQHGEITPRDLRDLVGYLASLESPPTRTAAQNVGLSEYEQQQIASGASHFERLCRGCHVPPLTYTTNGTFDIGLVDQAGAERFNPPSLRGVGQRDRLLHDASAGSIEMFLRESDHPSGLALSESELSELQAFLISL